MNEVSRKAYFQIKNIASREVPRHQRNTDAGTSAGDITIDYCNALLVGLPESVIGKLQRVQNLAARLILCL